MSDLLFEIIRFAALGILVVHVWRVGRRRVDLRRRGWPLLLGGLTLLLFGSLLDISDEFAFIAQYPIIGDTAVQGFLKKIVGYSGGFLLLTLGLLRWLPVIAGPERVNKLMNELQQANQQLSKGNKKLRRQMTARRLAERAIREDRRLLSAILESNRDGILVVEDKTRILQANRRFGELWGISEDLLRQEDDRKVLDHVADQVKDPVQFVSDVERLYASSEESNDIVHLKDGRVIERYSWPLPNDGKSCRRIWTFSDITTRYHAETDLRKLWRAVEQSSSTIVITDLDGRIEYVNQAFEQSTGYTREEVVGQTPSISKSGEQDPEFYRELWETITSGQQWKGEFQNRQKDGTLYWELATISPVADEDGTTRHYVAVRDDITEKRRVARELEEYATALETANESLRQFGDAAEAATRAKSQFLANMSHEIRTPMTAILGYTDILLGEAEQQSPEERVHALKTIQRNGQYLLDLLNDILDLSKIEAGRTELETIECSPFQVASDVVALMQVRAEAKNLPLEVEYEGLIPETIRTDPLRLRQVLINLMSNAIKFTEVGSIRLKVRCVAAGGISERMEFEMSDTGIGITPDQAQRLFQPFTQADNSTSRRFGGTGLGLTISKRLAEMLGGGITLRTEYGKGSTFCVAIDPGPLEGVRRINVADTYTAPAETSAEWKSIARELRYTILLAEDGHDNQRMIAFLLHKAGACVDLAENGQIAFDKAMQAASDGRPYSVILMDMQMPVMDGYQATRKLRDSGYEWPIVALTANAMAGDREKCLAAGCNEFASKPIDHHALAKAITSVLAPADGTFQQTVEKG